MVRARLFVAGWLLAIGAGCATPGPYFDPRGGTLPALSSQYRLGLSAQLDEQLRVGELRLEAVTWGDRRWRPGVDGLEALPVPALQAALIGTQRELRGAELDLYIERPDAPPTAATVWHELDGALRVELGGPPIQLDASRAPDAAELTRRFGIGPLHAAPGSRWSPYERLVLARALALLTPAELVFLRHLPFLRATRSPTKGRAGDYGRDGERYLGGRVALYDLAFAGDEHRVIGTPRAAYPISVHTVLHELGHAIAKLYREALLVQLERDGEKYNQLVERYNALFSETNRLRAALAVEGSRRRRAQLVEAFEPLERERLQLRAILRRAQGHFETARKVLRNPAPMERAYYALPGARGGPTPYGRTNAAESFAEAFALFHLDPACVRRISPAVHDWFAAGQHLQSAAYPELAASP